MLHLEANPIDRSVMKTRLFLSKYVILMQLLLLSNMLAHGNVPGTLLDARSGFQSPPDSTRTKVWWFHGETETTKFGITADLEALKKAGIGGVVYYDQVFGDQAGAMPAFSSGWWDMLKFSAIEAKRIGLTFETHVSNGYVAGGPWITYETGMKRLMATETVVEGGQEVSLTLPVPTNRYNYSKDVAVLAFPVPAGGGMSVMTASPAFSTNLDHLNPMKMFTPEKPLVQIPAQPVGQSVYIRLDFPELFTARSISYQMKPRGKASSSATNVPDEPGPVFVGTGYKVLPPCGQLEVSQDGLRWQKVCDLAPIYRAHESWQQKTVAFKAVQGRFFRLNLHDWALPDAPDKDLYLGNIQLLSDARMDQWEEKAGLFSEYIEGERTPSYGLTESIDPLKIVDLTSKLGYDGRLNWNAPKGRWIITRFAQVATGGSIKHGRNNFMGLECDKLSAEAAEIQFNHYFKPMLDTLRACGGNLSGMAMDSHEAGAQNWTDGFLAEFKTRRGYSLLPYLPVMWGRVVGSTEKTADVLYDVRRTIADLISDKYYGTFQRLCDREGVRFTAQATGNALCIVSDPIQAKSKVAVPQGEFWIIHPDGNYDIKESSSAAHLYGKLIASGEAFTGALYNHTLSDLKNIADGAYAFGINEFVVCASAYQPWDSTRQPGNVAKGLEWVVNRNNTWWNQSRDFWDYQARSAFLMRQGRPVVDLCVFLGDNAPVKILTYRLPELPAGYDFDAFSQDALLHRMSASDGRIRLPDGLSYAMMTLPRSGEITLAALQKIAGLVKDGAQIWGNRPIGSPSRLDMGKVDEYKWWTNLLWGNATSGVKKYGLGSVYYGMTLEEALLKADIRPDVQPENPVQSTKKLYVTHRALGNADVYFLNNHQDQAISGKYLLRSSFRHLQWWDPTTGRRFDLESSRNADGRLAVNLKLEPRESCFLVCTEKEEALPLKSFQKAVEIKSYPNGWMVNFPENRGGPGTITMDRLIDWTQSNQPGIRHFSGTAVYTKIIELDSLKSTKPSTLTLQTLNAVSTVYVNDQLAGTIWCSPWNVDVTHLLKPGPNKLEIRVTNTWINRLIGDASLPEGSRFSWTNYPVAKPTDGLQPSGLTGVLLELLQR